MAILLEGRAPVVRWEFPCSSPDEERVFLMQLSPMRESPDEPEAITGFVFSTVDITPSHASREALIDTGIALSRTLDLELVYREVALQVRRAVRGEAFCLAVADEETAALRVVHQYGYERVVGDVGVVPPGCIPPGLADAVEQRLKPAWLDALANERVVLTRSPGGIELTAPVSSAEGVLGAMTVLADDFDSPQRLEEATRLLTTLAAQTAAAVERAWLVRRVEQKRRLEAIGEVAAGVAHELRNPLFGISSAAQLLRFRVASDPMVEKNVGRILREVERLNRMVTALLEYGRPNAVRLTPNDPDAVWDDVLEGQRGRLEAKGLLLARERAAPPVRCLLDLEQLAQVFLNVLVNACDAAPDGTTLTLTTTGLSNGGWRMRLHNGGPAVPPEVLARVFEIFYSTKPGGTGIGLALCQRIVDEHGGTIAMESAPEAGTSVTITLPG
jgi:signal transduction histidine kinase